MGRVFKRDFLIANYNYKDMYENVCSLLYKPHISFLLFAAAKYGYLPIINSLIQDVRVTLYPSDLGYALFIAAYNGNNTIIRCLVSKGVNIHYDDDESIRSAIELGNLDTVSCLLEVGDYTKDQLLKFISYAQTLNQPNVGCYLLEKIR
jgi:ankyrin repeat protein